MTRENIKQSMWVCLRVNTGKRVCGVAIAHPQIQCWASWQPVWKEEINYLILSLALQSTRKATSPQGRERCGLEAFPEENRPIGRSRGMQRSWHPSVRIRPSFCRASSWSPLQDCPARRAVAGAHGVPSHQLRRPLCDLRAFSECSVVLSKMRE